MVIYFSGTGNSAYCARKIAATLGDELVNSADYIKQNKSGDFTSEKPWVFVCPTYAWQIPHIFEEFIRKSTFSGTKDACFIMTCGDDIGNAAYLNEKICSETGFHHMGTQAVVMPENYIAMFGVPDEDESKVIVKKAEKVLENTAKAISDGEFLTGGKVAFADKMKSGIVNRMFYSLCVRSKDFYAKDSCTACGKCERLCVTNCISMKNGKPVWGKGCTHCMACICSCPAQAIEYGKKSVGKRRYLCSEEN